MSEKSHKISQQTYQIKMFLKYLTVELEVAILESRRMR